MAETFIIGTCDTKWQEIKFVSDRLKQCAVPHKILDVSTTKHDHPVDIAASEVAKKHPERSDFLENNDGRGDAVGCMTDALAAFMATAGNVAGVIGLGGSGGTAIICSGMQQLPIGIPKVMVSTVASGQVAPYVGASDICMMYSVTDVAGINQVSNVILANAAHALAGMINNQVPKYDVEKPVLGLTMFGVTTPCVTELRQLLEKDYECLVFHATGTGGRSMEKLVSSGLMPYVLDMTTTEICDLHMGGVMSAGEERMEAIIEANIPYVLSLGALDMVNFGAKETIPEKYKYRLLYEHNPQVTLMRTTPDENKLMASWIAEKINRVSAPVRLYIPEKGVSSLSTEGQYFYDPEADRALFDSLEELVVQTDDRKIVRLPLDINDPSFAAEVAKGFREIALI